MLLLQRKLHISQPCWWHYDDHMMTVRCTVYGVQWLYDDYIRCTDWGGDPRATSVEEPSSRPAMFSLLHIVSQNQSKHLSLWLESSPKIVKTRYDREGIRVRLGEFDFLRVKVNSFWSTGLEIILHEQKCLVQEGETEDQTFAIASFILHKGWVDSNFSRDDIALLKLDGEPVWWIKHLQY